MSGADPFASGKGHRDENFPVASVLIAPRHRPVVLAFYRVARMADDVADHPTATPMARLAQLDEISRSLNGESEGVPEAVHLRATLAGRGLGVDHALDLLTAFRRDVIQPRTADWAALMEYCRYSAAPVGRFVLDVHGESRLTWPASDALCAALQVINHLQDCGKDYRELGRVYIPTDALAAADLTVEALGAARAEPALKRLIADLAGRAAALLDEARPLAAEVRDLRLAVEIGAIHGLAESLVRRLATRDPLSESVHNGRLAAFGAAVPAVVGVLLRRLAPRQIVPGAA